MTDKKIVVIGSGGLGRAFSKMMAQRFSTPIQPEKEPEHYKSLNKKDIYKTIKK